ncbi:hypothetical protein IAQ61_002644 [Plenodomus lingam]|uniref:uncharacterized protein n=1 Tax=Leptosphaeria maculans TaxID=5022 RepID=UPI00332008FA|nr:hypothetical protein IAQ61_002644 [Plenodomus lingam]
MWISRISTRQNRVDAASRDYSIPTGTIQRQFSCRSAASYGSGDTVQSTPEPQSSKAVHPSIIMMRMSTGLPQETPPGHTVLNMDLTDTVVIGRANPVWTKV